MKIKYFLLWALLSVGSTVWAVEYHVSVKGKDTNSGTIDAPFRTIGQAAKFAYSGDVITVHAGTYREWVNPPRGGESDSRRIVYRAAPGERVEIKGSERITNWEPVEGQKGVWKVVLPNSFFGSYNPYIDEIYGDWFDNYGRVHHTGEVFLNDKSLYEKETLEKVYHPEALPNAQDPEDIFLEVNHGPFLVENNILASRRSILEQSQGGAYVHNLICGKIHNYVEHGRYTPYFLPHSTEVAGLSIIPGGDDRFYNNLFATVDFENSDKALGSFGLKGYEKTAYPMYVDGNVYYGAAVPFVKSTRRTSDKWTVGVLAGR